MGNQPNQLLTTLLQSRQTSRLQQLISTTLPMMKSTRSTNKLLPRVDQRLLLVQLLLLWQPCLWKQKHQAPHLTEPCQQDPPLMDPCQQDRPSMDLCQQDQHLTDPCQQDPPLMDPCQQDQHSMDPCQQAQQWMVQCQQDPPLMDPCQQDQQLMDLCQLGQHLMDPLQLELVLLGPLFLVHLVHLVQLDPLVLQVPLFLVLQLLDLLMEASLNHQDRDDKLKSDKVLIRRIGFHI